MLFSIIEAEAFFSKGYSMYHNFCLFVAAVFFTMGSSIATEFVYCTTGSSHINDYGEELLKLALAKTADTHSLTRVNVSSRSHKRLIMEFIYGKNPCSVIIASSENLRLKGKMRMVPIPITKGLLGSRVFVYSEGIKSKWQATSTFEEIKSGFTIGSGSDWISSRLLREAGFFVTEGPSVETLWRMLYGGRFDLFHRGIYEAYDEKKQQAALGKNIYIDDRFLFTYKSDFFFYIKLEDKNRQEILTKGLEYIHKNGDFKNFFDKSFSNILKLDKSFFTGRIILQLNNKELPTILENIPDKFWH